MSRLEVREGESNNEVSVADVIKGTEEAGLTESTLELERLGTLVMDITSEKGRKNPPEVDTAISISVGVGVRVWGCNVVDGVSICVGVAERGLDTEAEKLKVLGTVVVAIKLKKAPVGVEVTT